jgi:16S rRNA (adenine1518-N6/adenine1519-N6)-dimethyltransferase
MQQPILHSESNLTDQQSRTNDILDPHDILRRYQIQAKKSWGQNFLINERVFNAIVAASDINSDDTVVEIGAGIGTLTSRLLHTGATVIAVERERDMCSILRAELGHRANFLLQEEDALQTKFSSFHQPNNRNLIVVGNLPYQIASPLIFHCLEQRQFLRRIVVMIQKEVADRLVAQPNTEGYSSMSAQVQLLANVRRICQVSRGSFIPAPRVDSTVVEITPLDQPRAYVKNLADYSKVVRAAFGQRRKTLRNSLGELFREKELPIDLLDFGRRAETLTVSEFAEISNNLSATNN